MVTKLKYNPLRCIAKSVCAFLMLTGFGCSSASHQNVRPTEPEPKVSAQDPWREVHNEGPPIDSASDSTAPSEPELVNTTHEALIAEQERLYNELLEEERNQAFAQPSVDESRQSRDTQVIVIEQEADTSCGCRRHWDLTDRCQFHRRLRLRQRRADARRQARAYAERRNRQSASPNERNRDNQRVSRRARTHARKGKARRAKAKRQRRTDKRLAKNKLKKYLKLFICLINGFKIFKSSLNL